METLNFKYSMSKIQNQQKAKLVYWDIISGKSLLKDHKDLLEYDLKTIDNKQYDYQILKNETYLILFFIGEKGIMFSTIRKLNEENWKYISFFNKEFNITIKENTI